MRGLVVNPALRFSFFRVFLGTYLYILLLTSIPSAGEVFGPDFFPASELIPNLLFPISWMQLLPLGFFKGALLIGAILSLLFALGVRRRLVAPALYLLLWILYQRNPLADSPEMAYLNWILLATCFVSDAEPFAFWRGAKASEKFDLPACLERSAWILLASGYAFAAYQKIYLGEREWLSGDAVKFLFLDSAPRRLWHGNFFASVPHWLAAVLTYGALSVQLLGPILIWNRTSRKVWWWAIFLMEITSAILLDVGWIVAGMILFQLFLWNPFLERAHSFKSQA